MHYSFILLSQGKSHIILIVYFVLIHLPIVIPVITISDAKFVGERSYMAFETPRDIRSSLDLRIQFKPEVTTGLLVYMAEHLSSRTSDFLAIELLDGNVVLRFNTGTDEPTVVRSGNKVEVIGMWI